MNETDPPRTAVVGDVVFGDPASPVAVCTLASRSLLPRLANRAEIAIAGRVFTENVGVERMVRNLAASPGIRYLIVAGRESRHRVGQTILSLHRAGLDESRRVIGSAAPDPMLVNVDPNDLRHFRERITVIDLIGEVDPERIVAHARALVAHPEPGASMPADRQAREPDRRPSETTEIVRATDNRPDEWRYDPTGFLLVFVDRTAHQLRVEHYSQAWRLQRVVEGPTAQSICHTLIRLDIVTEMTHAAYIGRELAKAEAALHLGLHYEQDSPLNPSRRA